MKVFSPAWGSRDLKDAQESSSEGEGGPLTPVYRSREEQPLFHRVPCTTSFSPLLTGHRRPEL